MAVISLLMTCRMTALTMNLFLNLTCNVHFNTKCSQVSGRWSSFIDMHPVFEILITDLTQIMTLKILSVTYCWNRNCALIL